MHGYLGIDVGSVSTNLVIIDDNDNLLSSTYLRTRGQPIRAVQEGIKKTGREIPAELEIAGVGSTGSARRLAGVIAGADTVKNEITAHAVAATHVVPGAQTVLEIGGQDSKIIILRNGIVVDFAMNTVCAAGTGSFLDHQAERLNIPIEEFGQLALQSKHPVRIAGRCSVFAESDMIHKQQTGHELSDIIAGLSEALVRNYLNNVGKGKDIQDPIIFQGGVAANEGIKASFTRALQEDITVPPHYDVMGALGAALIAKRVMAENNKASRFLGFELGDFKYDASSFECQDCPNNCEIVNIMVHGELLARWGSRCGQWDQLEEKRTG